MVNNTNINPINDSAFSFTKEEIYSHELDAMNRKKGSAIIEVGKTVTSSVPIEDLTTFNQNMLSTSSIIEKKDFLTTNLNNMATKSASNVLSQMDVPTVKVNFIQQIINNLIKGIISIILTPKIILSFIINHKIVYGPDATFTDAIDFIKKNKNLTNSIMRTISEEIIRILMGVALKEIASLVAAKAIKKQKEKAINKQAQLQSLGGVPSSQIKDSLNNTI